jgi:hypothetical protein
MARVMLKSPGRAGQGGWSSGFWSGEPVARNAGRRGWASTAWLVAGTLAVALTSYSLSLKVANERRELDRVARQNRALEGELKALDAELRVRMRMPQLQRWNDNVLGLLPISASQYLESPVRLADYGRPPAAALPQVQLAVRDEPVMLPAPRLQPVAEIGNAAPTAPSGPVRPSAAAAAPLLVAAPAPQTAPADLLQQVEMMASAPPGGDH